MDFWKLVTNSDFSGRSNIKFCCCSSLPWIREWKIMLVWSGTGYSVKTSDEQPGCSGGSRVALAHPDTHPVWQHRTVLLSFSSTGLFALSFPPLNNTSMILVSFSCEFFLVMSTSIALVKQYWHPFTQAAFQAHFMGSGHAEEKCPVAVKDQNVTTTDHLGSECEFGFIRATERNWNCWLLPFVGKCEEFWSFCQEILFRREYYHSANTFLVIYFL